MAENIIKVDRDLLLECFSLLGVADFKSKDLIGKRQDARDKLISILNK